MLAIAQRLALLAVALVVAWFGPPYVLAQRRWRSSVDFDEYRSAYRSARWFGADPSAWTVLGLRVVIIGFALFFAFPEFFERWF